MTLLFFSIVESGWFWLVLWLIGGTVCVAFDSDWLLILLSAGVLSGLKWLAGKGDLFTAQNLLALAPWLLAYVPCGILWSFVKWCWLLLDYKEGVLKGKKVYEEKGGEVWNIYKKKNFPQPKASDHKSKICRWIAYWPLSIVNSICYDFVKRFFSVVYECLGGTYDKIASWVLRGID